MVKDRTRPRSGKGKQSGQREKLNMADRGFYAPAFKKAEIDALDHHTAQGLKDEIALLRIVIRRLTLMSKEIEDFDEAITALGAVGTAATKLASVMRVQKMLGGDSNKTAEMISQALVEVMEEMDLQ